MDRLSEPAVWSSKNKQYTPEHTNTICLSWRVDGSARLFLYSAVDGVNMAIRGYSFAHIPTEQAFCT